MFKVLAILFIFNLYALIFYFWKELTLMLTFNFDFQNCQKRGPNLQKIPLPSKISGYTPEHWNTLIAKMFLIKTLKYWNSTTLFKT